MTALRNAFDHARDSFIDAAPVLVKCEGKSTITKLAGKSTRHTLLLNKLH